MTTPTATRVRAPRQRAPLAPGEDPLDTDLDEACRILNLPTVRNGYQDIAGQALKDRASYKQFLLDLLTLECDARDQRRKTRLVREAAFPRPKRIEDFDYAANPDVTPEVIATLCHPEWVRAGTPLCLIGDSGTGKSHLLIGIGTAIAEAGLRVRYTTTANLVNELAEAADERQLGRTIARYGRVDLLCLDEFGYLELDSAGAKLLFQVFTEREEKRSIAVASNAPFSEWQRTFTDTRLCSAIVDRLTYNAHIIETGSDSYRLRATTANKRRNRIIQRPGPQRPPPVGDNSRADPALASYGRREPATPPKWGQNNWLKPPAGSLRWGQINWLNDHWVEPVQLAEVGPRDLLILMRAPRPHRSPGSMAGPPPSVAPTATGGAMNSSMSECTRVAR